MGSCAGDSWEDCHLRTKVSSDLGPLKIYPGRNQYHSKSYHKNNAFGEMSKLGKTQMNIL